MRKSSIRSVSYLICVLGGTVLIFVAFNLIWKSYKLVPYVPVVLIVDRGNHMLRYDNSTMDSEHKRNICLILDEYNEYYQERGEFILIYNYLFQDMDTLQNYTNKAEGMRR